MTQSEKISIIVPVYKIEAYLDRCVASIANQTYQNLQIILVNDGSPDNCGAICDAWAAKDSRVKVIHKENGGVTSARLRGVAEASGDWIGFVDGDDCIEPWMYEKLIKNAEQYQAEISHCGYQMVLPTGRIRAYYNTGRIVLQDNHTGTKDLLEGKFVEPGLVNKLYRRSLFTDLDKEMKLDIRNNEDLLMNFYLFRKSKQSVYEDVCPYSYILREESAATSKLNIHQLEDPLTVRKILFEETKEEPDQHRIVGSQLVRHLVMLATMGHTADEALAAPVRQCARKELRGILRQILSGNDSSAKMKIIAVWAAIWPWSYGFVHRTYEKMTGLDTIYEK